MEDIVPALLEQIKREFAEAYETDQEITGIWERIDGEKAAAADIDAYATRTGDLLAEVLHRNISSDTLPDGRMYYNIANRVLSPVLEKNYDLVADVATLVQKQLNERAGIGIRPMRPEINRDRISGLVDLASDAERYDDVSGQVESGVLNYTQSVATDAVHDNAEFHYKAGLAPRIVRTAEAGCCQWCLDLAGTYDYKNVRNTGNDVYRRHANCRCTVEYDPGNGAKRQNVHSKQYSWKEDNEPLIEQRQQYSEQPEYGAVPKTWEQERNRDGSVKEFSLSGTNPNYNKNSIDGEYRQNCCNCVTAYEMRCRGYEVEAQPLSANRKLSRAPFTAWVNPEIRTAENIADIERFMAEQPNGTRVQIAVSYRQSIWESKEGHTFVVVRENDKNVFKDPQIGAIINYDKACEYLHDADIEYARIDVLDITDRGVSACRRIVR